MTRDEKIVLGMILTTYNYRNYDRNVYKNDKVISRLIRHGYITLERTGRLPQTNTRYLLTDKGTKVAITVLKMSKNPTSGVRHSIFNNSGNKRTNFHRKIDAYGHYYFGDYDG